MDKIEFEIIEKEDFGYMVQYCCEKRTLKNAVIIGAMGLRMKPYIRGLFINDIGKDLQGDYDEDTRRYKNGTDVRPEKITLKEYPLRIRRIKN